MGKDQIIQKTVLGSIFEQYRDKLLATISWHASFALKRKMSNEDIFQEAFIDACARLDYLNEKSDIPLLVKLKGIVIQTIANKERYCRAGKRTPNKEVHDCALNETQTHLLNRLADTITSPSKKILRKERALIVHQIINQMKPQDREIIIMHHFDQMNFNECAAILNIKIDTAKMRYFRAIERFKKLIDAFIT